MARKLTIKQDKFVREYVKRGNGKQAAIQAGYAERSAKQIACENLTKPDVAEQVAKYRQRNQERLDISREKLLNDAAHDAEQASLSGDYSASNGARTFIAKVQGYVVDRSISDVRVDVSIAHLDALKALMAARVRTRVITDVDDGDE